MVFVSSELYSGNLGGFEGADGKCQRLADAAGLPGQYKAWIGIEGTGPAQRFNQPANAAYQLTTGEVVATNWADLTDGLLAVNIDRDENGNIPQQRGNTSCAGGGFPTVWSGVRNNGEGFGNGCGGWRTDQGGGYWGRYDALNQWTSWCSGGLCSWVSPIYCFQQ